jgi:hypothetical protein
MECGVHIQRRASEVPRTIWATYYGSYNFPLKCNTRQVSRNSIERQLSRDKFVYINNPQLQTTFRNNMKPTRNLSLNFNTRFRIRQFWSPVMMSTITGISFKLYFRTWSHKTLSVLTALTMSRRPWRYAYSASRNDAYSAHADLRILGLPWELA